MCEGEFRMDFARFGCNSGLTTISQVSRSWLSLAYDGQLWGSLLLSLLGSDTMSSSALARLMEQSGTFVQVLDLRGKVDMGGETLVELVTLAGAWERGHTSFTSVDLTGKLQRKDFLTILADCPLHRAQAAHRSPPPHSPTSSPTLPTSRNSVFSPFVPSTSLPSPALENTASPSPLSTSLAVPTSTSTPCSTTQALSCLLHLHQIYKIFGLHTSDAFLIMSSLDCCRGTLNFGSSTRARTAGSGHYLPLGKTRYWKA